MDDKVVDEVLLEAIPPETVLVARPDGGIDKKDAKEYTRLRAKSQLLAALDGATGEKRDVRKPTSDLQARLNGQPYPIDQYNSGYNDAVDEIKQNIHQLFGEGKR